MRDWLARLNALLEVGPVAVITVLAAEGSTPREAGARMLVTPDSTVGTIGGGALEYAAIADARTLLTSAEPWQRRIMNVPLGPAVQQCCGGFVKLLIEVMSERERSAVREISLRCNGILARPIASGVAWRVAADRRQTDGLPLPVAKEARAISSGRLRSALAIISGEETWLIDPIQQCRMPLYLYGAGHVGREVVSVMGGLAFDITWVDVARSRFPAAVDPEITLVAADDPVAVARAAAPAAVHVVMTYSHALDEAITAALLERDTFAYLGLIGSKTKRARFVQRFRRIGINDRAIARLTCPIGAPGVPGKEPRAIAVALAAQLLQVTTAAAALSAITGSARVLSADETRRGRAP